MKESDYVNYWNDPKYSRKPAFSQLARSLPLVLPHKSTPKMVLEVYENLIKCTPNEYQPPVHIPPMRLCLDIKGFSYTSRMKLFTKFNMLNYSQYGIPLFISATFHFDNPDDMISIKYFLEKYVKMLKRFLNPFHYVWKLEYQKRGSPHFHLLLFPLNPEHKFYSKKNERLIRKKWMQLKQCKCKHCIKYALKVVECKTRLMSISYIAKEIAKVQDTYQEHNLGRVWGMSQGMRMDRVDKIVCDRKYFDEIINAKLKENYRNPGTKDYLLCLKNTIEPRSIFIDTKTISGILSDAKANSLPEIDSSKPNQKGWNIYENRIAAEV